MAHGGLSHRHLDCVICGLLMWLPFFKGRGGSYSYIWNTTIHHDSGGAQPEGFFNFHKINASNHAIPCRLTVQTPRLSTGRLL